MYNLTYNTQVLWMCVIVVAFRPNFLLARRGSSSCVVAIANALNTQTRTTHHMYAKPHTTRVVVWVADSVHGCVCVYKYCLGRALAVVVANLSASKVLSWTRNVSREPQTHTCERTNTYIRQHFLFVVRIFAGICCWCLCVHMCMYMFTLVIVVDVVVEVANSVQPQRQKRRYDCVCFVVGSRVSASLGLVWLGCCWLSSRLLGCGLYTQSMKQNTHTLFD